MANSRPIVQDIDSASPTPNSDDDELLYDSIYLLFFSLVVILLEITSSRITLFLLVSQTLSHKFTSL